MFHVFRNSPLGRENLLQSIYFCEQVGNLELSIYLPVQKQALMYFERTSVTLDLDSSYTRFPSTAARHVVELMGATKVRYRFVKPISFTASTLPDLPTRWHVMACPRVMSQHVSRIGLGHIGPRVRAIAKHASFSVFVPSLCFKVWRRVAVFFGGSDLGVKAVRQAISLAERASVPLTVYTQGDASVRKACEAKIAEAGLDPTFAQPDCQWQFFESGSLEENLYEVSSDSLVVVGAAGSSSVRDLLFGSTLELIQKTLPNPLVVVGSEARVF